jgi:hypothetical protein
MLNLKIEYRTASAGMLMHFMHIVLCWNFCVAAATVDDVREACNKMDLIFTNLNQVKNDSGDGVSKETSNRLDAGQSMNGHFYRLTSESFSTDPSEASRIEGLGVSRKASITGWDTAKVPAFNI